MAARSSGVRRGVRNVLTQSSGRCETSQNQKLRANAEPQRYLKSTQQNTFNDNAIQVVTSQFIELKLFLGANPLQLFACDLNTLMQGRLCTIKKNRVRQPNR